MDILSVEDPSNPDVSIYTIDNIKYTQECLGNLNETSETIYPQLQFFGTTEYPDPGSAGVMTDQMLHTGPSTDIQVDQDEVPHETALSDVPKEAALPEVPQEAALPELPQEAALPEVLKEAALPEVPQEAALPEVPQEVALPEVPQETALPEVPQEAALPEMAQDIVWMKKGSPSMRPDSGYGGSSNSEQDGSCWVELQMYRNSGKSRMAKVPANMKYRDIWVTLHQQTGKLYKGGHYQLQLSTDNKFLPLANFLDQSIRQDQLVVIKPQNRQ